MDVSTFVRFETVTQDQLVGAVQLQDEWDFCWGSKQKFAGAFMVTSIYLK